MPRWLPDPATFVLALVVCMATGEPSFARLTLSFLASWVIARSCVGAMAAEVVAAGGAALDSGRRSLRHRLRSAACRAGRRIWPRSAAEHTGVPRQHRLCDVRDPARYHQPMVPALLARITVDPDRCGGRPCVRGMRIRVTDVLDLLAGGLSRDEVLGELPDLEPEDVEACLRFASRRIDHPILAA